MTLTQPAPQRFYHRHNTMPRLLAPPRPHHPGIAHAGRSLLTRHEDAHLLRARTVSHTQRDVRLLVDLTSPWAYLAHLRLDRAAGVDGGGAEAPTGAPEWHVFQPMTSRPMTGLRAPGPEQDRARDELEAVRAVALDGEEIPESLPSVLPHPRPVAAAYAEGVDLGRGPQVRAALLHAYWVEGRDIGDPEVLRRILPAVLVDDDTLCTGDPRREWGYVVSPAREPLSDEAYHLLERWQREWLDLGRPEPLALVGDGEARVGAAALTPTRAAVA